VPVQMYGPNSAFRWFSSVPGPTWPNRFFVGHQGVRANRDRLVMHSDYGFRVPAIASILLAGHATLCPGG
jgi:hypothetical protein